MARLHLQNGFNQRILYCNHNVVGANEKLVGNNVDGWELSKYRFCDRRRGRHPQGAPSADGDAACDGAVACRPDCRIRCLHPALRRRCGPPGGDCASSTSPLAGLAHAQLQHAAASPRSRPRLTRPKAGYYGKPIPSGEVLCSGMLTTAAAPVTIQNIRNCDSQPG
jgi:hypothetical protein